MDCTRANVYEREKKGDLFSVLRLGERTAGSIPLSRSIALLTGTFWKR